MLATNPHGWTNRPTTDVGFALTDPPKRCVGKSQFWATSPILNAKIIFWGNREQVKNRRFGPTMRVGGILQSINSLYQDSIICPFCRTSSSVRLCWELEEPQGPDAPPPQKGGSTPRGPWGALRTWRALHAAVLVRLSSGLVSAQGRP